MTLPKPPAEYFAVMFDTTTYCHMPHGRISNRHWMTFESKVPLDAAGVIGVITENLDGGDTWKVHAVNVMRHTDDAPPRDVTEDILIQIRDRYLNTYAEDGEAPRWCETLLDRVGWSDARDDIDDQINNARRVRGW